MYFIVIGILVVLIFGVVVPLCSSDPKLDARWNDYKEGRISLWRDFIFELDLKEKTNKEKPMEVHKPITIRRFYHPNAYYTQPLPAHYVSDIIWSKAEFFKLDWVKRFTSNHEDKAGNHFVFKKMEVVLDDAYPDFDDLEIKCGCFAVFEAPNATERRFIGLAENEFSTDKFFEWFATTEEQNKWKIKRQILKDRLAENSRT